MILYGLQVKISKTIYLKINYILKHKSFATVLHPCPFQHGPCLDVHLIIYYAHAQCVMIY